MDAQLGKLQNTVADVLAEARKHGASAAEVAANSDRGLSATVRLGEVETIEHTNDNGLGITVYFGRHKGSATTADLSPAAVRETLEAACNIARHTQEDPCAGLADAGLMPARVPDLDLYHPWNIGVDGAIELALACETAARDSDARITNSEGATCNTNAGIGVYGNSHGFVAGYPGTRHDLSCAVVGQQGDSMQRDYWYTSARCAEDMASADNVGATAAARTLEKLQARRISSREAPVLFRSDVAVGLLRSFVGAIRGSALYRKASFLLDQLDQPLFPEWVHIRENPLLPRGLASAAFDGEGVVTRARDLVSAGVLRSYVLDSYSACRLNMESTGNAGGVRNLSIDSGDLDYTGLLREMDTGLVVTDLMGHGVNAVTGDYSQGAAGFWVEGGVVQFPVEEITVAGNLRDMFRQLRAVGTDRDNPGSVRTGSWLIEQMTIAGS
ncbi:MAG: metalloprotease PmbA [Pseudomonadota bacterium]